MLFANEAAPASMTPTDLMGWACAGVVVTFCVGVIAVMVRMILDILFGE